MIVLDTHAWIWWLTTPAKLGRKAARSIKKASRIGVPAISVWEVAMKAKRGKIRFNRPYAVWLDEALVADQRILLLALAPRISVTAVELNWEHADPVDRLIVASARVHEAPLITADECITDAGLVQCVWD
jgi:PIN domain nuclease of toxin-antitoxin system